MNVKSANRTLAVLEVFSDLGKPLSLSELSRLTGIPISSCHGLVHTLKQRGYLYALLGSRQFYPTKRLEQMALAIARHDPILGRLVPHMQALRNATGETIILGKNHDHNVIYLEVVEGTSTVRYTAQAGEQKPLHSSAIGKALLAHLDPHALAQTIATLPLTRITDNTITSVRKLRADIKLTRHRGYSLTRGENVSDVMAIAIAIDLGGGQDPVGLAVAGPLQRMRGKLEQQVEALRAAKSRLDTAELATTGELS